MSGYYARDGRVYTRVDGVEVEAATALTANGRDLERHDRALQRARAQCATREPTRCPTCRGEGIIAGTRKSDGSIDRCRTCQGRGILGGILR